MRSAYQWSLAARPELPAEARQQALASALAGLVADGRGGGDRRGFAVTSARIVARCAQHADGDREPDLADFEQLLEEPFVAVCRRDHALARRRSVAWSELREFDFMTVGKSSGNRLLMDLALADADFGATHLALLSTSCVPIRPAASLLAFFLVALLRPEKF